MTNAATYYFSSVKGNAWMLLVILLLNSKLAVLHILLLNSKLAVLQLGNEIFI